MGEVQGSNPCSSTRSTLIISARDDKIVSFEETRDLNPWVRYGAERSHEVIPVAPPGALLLSLQEMIRLFLFEETRDLNPWVRYGAERSHEVIPVSSRDSDD